ncbi:hypothetical protein CYL31_11655 [Marinomonas sp. A3A]|uniref:hypothetical protein n=1 Tax=Marinomonas sp. A3A TaxID=2065312 RepID=UPI001BB3A018|nr:hypothetical protein [Marinomonas sp. A3A]QUX92029.1 hypothetical protein CYL31_11655 [Marinomonas sp. A3A]
MALHPHVQYFYNEWLNKADSYVDKSLSGYFNKAFSLFTLYNKLYAEATFSLARAKIIKLNERQGFPDRKGATIFAPQYIGYENLERIFSEDECARCIDELAYFIETGRFYIKLSMLYGKRQQIKDKELAENLRSKTVEVKVNAVMDYIYTVRCNMFHGNKQFDEVQVDLLEPIIIILRKVIVELYDKLSDSEFEPRGKTFI